MAFPLLAAPTLIFPRTFLIACVPIAAVGLHSIEVAFSGTLDVGGIYGTARCLLEFWLGMGLLKLAQQPSIAAFLARDAWILLASGAVAGCLHFQVSDTATVAALASLIVVGASNRGRGRRLLETRGMLWLGEISYSVYMIHWPLLVAVPWLWQGFRKEKFGTSFSSAGSFLVLTAAIGVVLLLAHLTWRYFELPWRRRLRGEGAA
jgi:peptidoglycan/LPS O-acetylase OafA/YrhL